NLPLCPLLVVVLQNFCKGEIRFNRCYLCTSLCKRNGKTTRRCSNIQNGISFKYYSLFFQPTYNSFCTLFSLFAKALIIILLSGFVKGTFRNNPRCFHHIYACFFILPPSFFPIQFIENVIQH